MQSKGDKVVRIPPNDYIKLFPNEITEKLQLSITQAKELGQVKIFEGNEIIAEINNLLLTNIKNKLKMFFWSNEEKYHLPDMISIEDIKTKLDQLPVIKAIFKLGGYDASQIPNILEGQTETDFANIYGELSKIISSEVQSRWRTNKKLEIRIEHKKDHLLINIGEPGYQIEPRYRSEGLRWFLAFIIGMIAQGENLKDSVILIDEPALHLHPGGQKDVLKEINRLAVDNQIIYSTHSHFMIDRRYRERVLFLIKNVENGYSLTDIKIPNKQDIFKDPLLRSALIYSISDLSFLNENNILVEGVLDKRIIDIISNWLTKKDGASTIDLNNTSVISCGGASEIKKHAKLYKSSDLVCLSLYDSDKKGKDANESNTDQKTLEKINIKDIYSQGETMEDLIPVEAFKDALQNWISDNKILGNDLISKIKPPRMKKINQTMDSYIQKKGFSGKDFSDERLRLKHDLEDKITLKVSDLLENLEPTDEKLINLMSLNLILVERLNSLLS